MQLHPRIGRYGGTLSAVRTDDLAAIPIKALMERHPGVDWKAVTDVLYGCANQAGEDNQKKAYGIAAGGPSRRCTRCHHQPAVRLWPRRRGSAARAIRAGEARLMIAGGVESMSRAPFVMPKADSAFSRSNAIYDTTIGWRFINKQMKALYGVDSMPETAENVADDFKIEREAQDRMALASQQKAAAAIAAGYLAKETRPCISHKKREMRSYSARMNTLALQLWKHWENSRVWCAKAVPSLQAMHLA